MCVKGVPEAGIEHHAHAQRIGGRIRQQSVLEQRSRQGERLRGELSHARDKALRLRGQLTGRNCACSVAGAGGWTGQWAGTFAADIVVVVSPDRFSNSRGLGCPVASRGNGHFEIYLERLPQVSLRLVLKGLS